ncbi:hypothetical protein CB1_001961002 [Camelus ferus]|nr:hypothetical protein CB1_001961002 [Camelus ferus]
MGLAAPVRVLTVDEGIGQSVLGQLRRITLDTGSASNLKAEFGCDNGGSKGSFHGKSYQGSSCSTMAQFVTDPGPDPQSFPFVWCLTECPLQPKGKYVVSCRIIRGIILGLEGLPVASHLQRLDHSEWSTAVYISGLCAVALGGGRLADVRLSSPILLQK